MKLFFAAGDVGGARAILPIASLAHCYGCEVFALAHGFFKDEGSQDWAWFDFPEAINIAKECDAVIYATSVNDMLAVEIAKCANEQAVPSVHVLDNWSSYADRISTFNPDIYAVMDEVARSRAELAGVDTSILRVTGHPGLAKLAVEIAAMSNEVNLGTLLFVSEPVSSDGGVEKRGYDETIVAKLFVEELVRQRASVGHLFMAPHPRENRVDFEARMSNLFASYANLFSWSVVGKGEVRSALHSSSHIVGMSSLLLYEAWLLGKPTLSLQPGLKDVGLSELKQRSGLVFHAGGDDISLSVNVWLSGKPKVPNKELAQHEHAAERIIAITKQLVQERKS